MSKINTNKADAKILIAEDHKMTATLIQRHVENFHICEILGIAYDGEKIIELAEKTNPDIIIMDINLPTIDGITAMISILRKNPNVKVIMLTSHEEPWVIKRSIDAGAMGYFTKKTPFEHLKDAIDIIHTGGTYLDKNSLDIIVNSFDQKNRLN